MKFYRAYTMTGVYLYGRVTPSLFNNLVAAVNVIGGCRGTPGLWDVYFAATRKELRL